VIDRIKLNEKNVVAVSALTGQGIDELVALIEKQLPKLQFDIKVLIPYDHGDLLGRIYKEGHVDHREDTNDGVLIVGQVPEALAKQLEAL
jgi:GTP-binding protein HflX